MAKDTKKEELKSSTALATQGTRGVAVYDEEFAHGSAGMENVSADEIRLPTLRVLDPKSPQVAPPERGGIGAKAGDILISGLNEFWEGGKGEKSGFFFLPVEREQRYVEWVPRDPNTGKGGGFVGVHMANEPIVGALLAKQGKFGKLKMDNGNELVQTFTLFCLVQQAAAGPDAVWMEAMIHFASTQIPKYQSIVNRTRTFLYNNRLPAFWQHKWRMLTQMDPPNKAGQTWYGWVPQLAGRDEEGRESYRASFVSQFARNEDGTLVIENDAKVANPLYEQAYRYYKMISEQKVKVDYATTNDESGETGGAGGGGDPDADIPM